MSLFVIFKHSFTCWRQRSGMSWKRFFQFFFENTFEKSGFFLYATNSPTSVRVRVRARRRLRAPQGPRRAAGGLGSSAPILMLRGRF